MALSAVVQACIRSWPLLIVFFFYFCSRNPQTCPFRFDISELGSLVHITFDRGFSTDNKSLVLGLLRKVVHVCKIFSDVYSNQDFSGTGDHS